MMDALGEGWIAEYALSLGRLKAGYPTHYKIDCANPPRKFAIEVDGNSHHVETRKVEDAKKEAMLRSLGWTVLRFWNEEILNWSNSGRPTESYISMTLAQHGIHPIR
jgi:very-short-patch-repair endonuclease